MKILLDTHILIWAIIADDKLSREAFTLINDSENEVYYSAVSVWEIVMKHSKAPDRIPLSGDVVVNYCGQSDFQPLPMLQEHALMLATIHRDENTPQHTDPFDRLLIAQAKYEEMTLLTHDRMFKYYSEPCVRLV